MKAIIQRVISASVTVNSKLVSSIGKGLLVLAAVSPSDTAEDCTKLAQKILNLKLWPSADGKAWGSSVVGIQGEILLVSQFTLLGNIKKGSKPDFHAAAPPDVALPIYTKLVEIVADAYRPERVKDGEFGAMMQVGSVNDGPVTFEFDTNFTRFGPEKFGYEKKPTEDEKKPTEDEQKRIIVEQLEAEEAFNERMRAKKERTKSRVEERAFFKELRGEGTNNPAPRAR